MVPFKMKVQLSVKCQSLLGVSDDHFGIYKHKDTPYVKNLLDL